jgi:hypothetical protein
VQTTVTAPAQAQLPRWLLPAVAAVIAMAILVVLLVSVANGNDAPAIERSPVTTHNSNQPPRAF